MICLSDGCGGQFKSKFTAYEMTHYCERFCVEEYSHTFAPTGNFKCMCDSRGNDTKLFMYRSERDSMCRCTNAWEVFCWLDENMPAPAHSTTSTSKQFQLSASYQCYVTREDQMNAAMRGKLVEGKVVLVQPPMGSRVDREVKAIPGIIKPGVYQFRVTNDHPSGTILMYRDRPCWCANCVKSDYVNCLSQCEWTSINLSQGAPVAVVHAPVVVVVVVVVVADAPVVDMPAVDAAIAAVDAVEPVVNNIAAAVRSSSRQGKGQHSRR